MPVDGEGLPRKALEKRWCLSLFLKAGRVGMDERWHGSLFQKVEATDENDLDFAMSTRLHYMNYSRAHVCIIWIIHEHICIIWIIHEHTFALYELFTSTRLHYMNYSWAHDCIIWIFYICLHSTVANLGAFRKLQFNKYSTEKIIAIISFICIYNRLLILKLCILNHNADQIYIWLYL